MICLGYTLCPNRAERKKNKKQVSSKTNSVSENNFTGVIFSLFFNCTA